MVWIRIAHESQLKERTTLKFSFMREGVKIEAFLVKFDGKVAAYENVCRHIPISIDYADNRFFTQDQRHLICQTHGAIYEPSTGKCIRGPCTGASLYSLDVVAKDGELWLRSLERKGVDSH
ncbi:MAG: Rieske 2Fe-2S domain-containing protein [Verrucomicrobia bacterium]|nr:Rieske 2Fe-2S domain-containing protein [Verrucomicrobiota bacterium]